MEHHHGPHEMVKKRHKLQDFAPLIIIFVVILLLTAMTANVYEGGTLDAMRLFMGYFFLAFGAFKVLNWKGFVDAYQVYDVIAKKSRAYGYLYPVIELALGFAYIASFELVVVSWITLVVMLVSAYGVFIKLRKKEEVPCACLGVVFKIPMTWVTLGEDLLMAVMALIMIVTI